MKAQVCALKGIFLGMMFLVFYAVVLHIYEDGFRYIDLIAFAGVASIFYGIYNVLLEVSDVSG